MNLNAIAKNSGAFCNYWIRKYAQMRGCGRGRVVFCLLGCLMSVCVCHLGIKGEWGGGGLGRGGGGSCLIVTFKIYITFSYSININKNCFFSFHWFAT